VHKRSLVFLFAAAAQQCKAGPLTVGAPLGASLKVSLGLSDSGLATVPETSATQCDELLAAMRALVAEARPIVRVKVPRSEAIAHFTKTSKASTYNNASHTLAWLQACTETHVNCHACDLGPDGSGRFLAIDRGPLVPTTAALEVNHFSLEIMGPKTYRLRHAVPQNSAMNATSSSSFALPLSSAEATPEPLLEAAFEGREAWNTTLGMRSIADVNAAVGQGRKLKSLVQVSEALHDKHVVEIAAQIAGASVPSSQRPRLVLIAGPTSSGKTTFAKRLGVALEALGAQPTVVSVDSYYRGWPDIDARGAKHVDWEAMGSLNLELLNAHLVALLRGESVRVPEYDMKTSMPMSEEHWTPTQLASGGLVIMEGIHCLNPALTPKVPRSDKFGVCITPLPALFLDDLALFSSSHLRMLRRMVRDYLNRGRSPRATLQQWPGVASGERANIFPHQNQADVVFNSALVYEVHALKPFAEPLLKTIAPDHPEYAEARRLLAALDQVASLPGTQLLVPPQSLLREFIGGSWFYDYSGWYKTA